MFKARFKLYICCFLVALSPKQASASGSVIGNGGDPLFYFLEATRFAMVETVKAILANPKDQEKLCQDVKLSTAQTNYCRAYFLAIANQVLALNQGTDKTLFVLREEPLSVEGPDGKPMPVAARTELGGGGPVEFQRDLIKLMSPADLLFTMEHEFAHKASFESRFVTDNDAIGPFQIGRELIDAMAHSVVAAAKRHAKIGTQYDLRDSFVCIVQVNSEHFGVRESTARFFLSDDLMSYETSLSSKPTDPTIFVPETPDTLLIFRLLTTEPANCSEDNKFDTLRHTEISIVRQHTANAGNNPSSPEEVLTSKSLPGFNPMCGKVHSDFGLEYKAVRFSCRYYGTEGSAIAMLANGRRGALKLRN